MCIHHLILPSALLEICNQHIKSVTASNINITGTRNKKEDSSFNNDEEASKET